MEAAELGAFMVSACFFTTVIWHPRRGLTGVSHGPHSHWHHLLALGEAVGRSPQSVGYSEVARQSRQYGLQPRSERERKGESA